MVIDFHAHTFPASIAARAVEGLARGADMRPYSDGTGAGLLAAMDRAGIDLAVLQPVVTKPGQARAVNDDAARTDRAGGRLRSFGGIHPDCGDYRELLRALADSHVPGVKLHPLFQRVGADDIRYIRIVNTAAELGLRVLIHAGLDPNFPGEDLASPERIERLLKEAPGAEIVLAHMGGLGQWSRAGALLGAPVYLDTACALSPWRDRSGAPAEHPEYEALGRERFVRFVRAHGARRVLFGTDSPWNDPAESLSAIRASGLTAPELDAVLAGNARRLLGIPDKPPAPADPA